MRKRRVRVTARSRRIAVSQVTGCRQIVTEMAAPAELRTPLGTAAKVAMRVRMEAWRQWRATAAGQNSMCKNQRTRRGTQAGACHSLLLNDRQVGHPSRLPGGSLRSALTGPGRPAEKALR